MDTTHTLLVATIAALSSVMVSVIGGWFNRKRGLTPASERYEALMTKENEALRRQIVDLQGHIARLEATSKSQEQQIAHLNRRLDELAEEKREVEAENVMLRIRLAGAQPQ